VSAGKVGDLEIRALVRGLCSPSVVGFSFVSLVAVFFYDQVDFFWFRSLFSFLQLLGAVVLFSHPVPIPGWPFQSLTRMECPHLLNEAVSPPYLPSAVPSVSCIVSFPLVPQWPHLSSRWPVSRYSCKGRGLGAVWGDRTSGVLMHRWMASFFDSSSLYYVRVRFLIGFGLVR